MAIQMFEAASAGNGCFIATSPANNLVDLTAAFTMMYWVNMSSIAATSGAGATASSQIGVYGGPGPTSASTSGMQMGLNQGGTTAGTFCCWKKGGTNLVASVAASAVINTWIHMAYTCTESSNGAGTAGTQTHSLYINGVLNNTNSNALQVAGVPSMIFFNGFPSVTQGSESNATQVDDVCYFNRLLSADEIQTIYQSQGLRDGDTYGLIARFNLNELAVGANVVSCTDFSGNGNTATPTLAGTGTTPTYIASIACGDTRPPLG